VFDAIVGARQEVSMRLKKKLLVAVLSIAGFALAPPAAAVNHPFIPANDVGQSPNAGGNNAVACTVGAACPKSTSGASDGANATNDPPPGD
jgi:hypothetical protein